MIQLLKSRALLISVLFGLFGNALAQLLVIDEMTWYYTALASLISLVINLLATFLLRGRNTNRRRNYVKLFCLLTFIGLIATVYLHTKYFMAGTFPYSGYDEKVSYYVKGTEYTPLALKFKEEHPEIQSDSDLVHEGFGSPSEKDRVWTAQSIDQNKLKLISSYSLVVMFFVGLISVLLEVIPKSDGSKGHIARNNTRVVT
ncbi:hypothetical protein [Adhaeribacter pallidiroseus]|uniref:Uncharacterized protein n=1 Tax=Adhaeribacter pallidiroseus TaxID=2072847 RepID=A0A369QIJ5_9BACT|nr:hypothetical protein [Adhaeribacter pallidiroseus]RDC62699.1 hypothetical protein AHMF7616_01293 [Adhaeribacter pallidiroseus]